jgi:ABC-type microcin C transport system permease subunit YejB
MAQYIIKRLLLLPFLLIIFSIIAFALIQAPPGDFVTSYMAELSASGSAVDQAQIDACVRSMAWISRCMSNISSGWVTSYKGIWGCRWIGTVPTRCLSRKDYCSP